MEAIHNKVHRERERERERERRGIECLCAALGREGKENL
jgi:hypothetical protein